MNESSEKPKRTRSKSKYIVVDSSKVESLATAPTHKGARVMAANLDDGEYTIVCLRGYITVKTETIKKVSNTK